MGRMTSVRHAPAPRAALVGLLLVIVVGAGAIGVSLSAAPASAVPTRDGIRGPGETGVLQPIGRVATDVPDAPPGLRGELRRSVGEGDGALPNGTTVFDVGLPGVTNLDPDLLDALRAAASAAEDEGIVVFVDSGWRSATYQEQLLTEAAATYGSEEEAARWVATPATSAHVSGDAVDIGQSDATAWLSERGAAYALCQIYANEPWHYELRPDAPARGCPAIYPDPTHDPRMRR